MFFGEEKSFRTRKRTMLFFTILFICVGKIKKVTPEIIHIRTTKAIVRNNSFLFFRSFNPNNAITKITNITRRAKTEERDRLIDNRKTNSKIRGTWNHLSQRFLVARNTAIDIGIAIIKYKDAY